MCSCEVQWIAFGGDIELGEGHEEKATECCSKESTVDRLESAVWRRVDVQTRGAEELNSLLARYVIATNGEDTGLITENARAGSKVLKLVLVCHLLYAGPRCYVTLVNEAVEELRAAFDFCDIVGDFHVSAFRTSPIGNVIAVLVSHLYIIVLVFFLFLFFFLLLFFLLVFFWLHV